MRATVAALALALAACEQAPEPPATPAPITPVIVEAPSGEYALDPTHSSVVIRANHFGLSNYAVRLATLSGTLAFDAQQPARSRVTATAAANSVRTEYVGRRDFDDELENSEWLDAANHPAITFTSSSIELTGPNTGRMTGDLSMRGVTHPATFEVTFNRAYRQHPMGMPMALLGFSARGTIKRSDYGMRVLLPATTGGVGVSDELDVQIEAEFAQPAAPANPVN